MPLDTNFLYPYLLDKHLLLHLMRKYGHCWKQCCFCPMLLLLSFFLFVCFKIPTVNSGAFQ